MSREGRSQPIQPAAWHGFVDPGPGPVGTTPPGLTVVPLVDERRRFQPPLPAIILNGALAAAAAPQVVVPPQPLTVEPEDRRRRYRALIDPIVVSGVLAPVTAPAVFPPAPNVVSADRRRTVHPDATVAHGSVDSGVGVPGTAPPPPVSVDRADQRDRYRALPPVTLSGAENAAVFTPPPTPTPPVIIPLFDERRRSQPPLTPSTTHGFVDSGVGAPGTVPPAPLNVDRADQRGRYRPLDPITISAAYNAVAPPTATPPAPFVVPLQQLRRILDAQPNIQHGFDDVPPPHPTVTEPDDRKRRASTPDPLTVSGALAGFTPDFIPPPGPFVVPIEERRWILDRLRQPTSSHGFVGNTPANGVLPPSSSNSDRVDQRARYLPQPTLVMSGVLAPFLPPPPVTVNAGTDWAAEMSTW